MCFHNLSLAGVERCILFYDIVSYAANWYSYAHIRKMELLLYD